MSLPPHLPVNETVPRRHPGLTAQQSAPALRCAEGRGGGGCQIAGDVKKQKTVIEIIHVLMQH